MRIKAIWNPGLTCAMAFALVFAPPAAAAPNDCGRPVSSGAAPTASDALFVLGAAIGLQTCPLCVCDTNGSGGITAGDALVTLSAAVGAGTGLACGPCTVVPELDCVREEYPCTVADADPIAFAAALALLSEAWDLRDAGTMQDVRDYLESQSEIVEIAGDERIIRFVVDGAPPVFFEDRTSVDDIEDVPEPTLDVAARPARTVDAVVGEDSNSDGTVDQRDTKRALVLGPYEWQFSAFDSAKYIAPMLSELEAYQGRVEHKSNFTESDRDISIEDYRDFDDYDVVFVGTHGARFCDIGEDGRCEIVIASGIFTDNLEPPDFTDPGVMIGSHYDANRNQSSNDRELLLTLDFWRTYYGGSLDNQLVSFSACETGNFEGSELATALGSENFVTTGWTETVFSTDQLFATRPFYEEMIKGLTTEQALRKIEDRGLIPKTNPQGFPTTFERFAPGGGDVRIIELPRLMYEGGVMPDGLNVIDLVTGTVGDTNPDSMRLTVRIDGVTEDTKQQFQVRYRVADMDVAGTYGLGSATLVSGFEHRYEVVHDVALGFPLVVGDLPIEVIVDLPEGGESRYVADVSLASCSFTVRLSGDHGGMFDGPAQFEIDGDGAIKFTLRSRGWINADIATSAQANFTTAPGSAVAAGQYDIVTAGVGFNSPVYSAIYQPIVEDLTCATCGGSAMLDTVEEESISGSATVTMVRLFPEPENEQGPTVLMHVEFIAAFGSQFDATSPYVRCSIQYADDE